MKTAFVDTQYFVAVFQPSDQWHQRAISIEAAVAGYSFVTTDAILAEVLNFFCEHGPNTRREAVVLVESVLAESSFFVVELNREWFQRGVNFYGSRPDKIYIFQEKEFSPQITQIPQIIDFICVICEICG